MDSISATARIVTPHVPHGATLLPRATGLRTRHTPSAGDVLREPSGPRLPRVASPARRLLRRPGLHPLMVALLATLPAPWAWAQTATLAPVTVSGDTAALARHDFPGSIDDRRTDPANTAAAGIDLTERLQGIPGVQARNRQNYAQDLQVSIRGFGARSTFGVRGVRMIVDGIPGTMPDGQGQVSHASLSSASRVEVIRGPFAQLYGNAAGGVVRIFSEDPPMPDDDESVAWRGRTGLHLGSDGLRKVEAVGAFGTRTFGGTLDVSRFSTDGYRDHGEARRTQANARFVARPSSDTTVTAVLNALDQPLAQDPLGLTRDQFEADPRQSVPGATLFDTRKRVKQQQAGLTVKHQINTNNTVEAAVYTGRREMTQYLAFSGEAPTASGGVIDLSTNYSGMSAGWTHHTTLASQPMAWTFTADANRMDQARRGYVNLRGTAGDLRRNERDRISDMGATVQGRWQFAPTWEALLAVRWSRVRFTVDDYHINAFSPDDSGTRDYTQTSPVAGLAWSPIEPLRLYAQVGRGFETPTMTELAYSPDGSGVNRGLQASRSLQTEVGAKYAQGIHTFQAALFHARSRDEIVPVANQGGRTIFQNAERVSRRGVELGWQMQARQWRTEVAWTLLDARFDSAFTNGPNTIPAGHRLPGTARHNMYAQVQYEPDGIHTLALDGRAESRTWADDANTQAAPGYAVMGAQVSRRFQHGAAQGMVYLRVDNLFDRHYAGSVIVNESNGRYFEPAPGRTLLAGIRIGF